MTLEQIIANERAHRVEGGMFGIDECKHQIRWEVEYYKQSLYQRLEEYVNRAKTDRFFNKHMILACWELINEQ